VLDEKRHQERLDHAAGFYDEAVNSGVRLI